MSGGCLTQVQTRGEPGAAFSLSFVQRWTSSQHKTRWIQLVGPCLPCSPLAWEEREERMLVEGTLVHRGSAGRRVEGKPLLYQRQRAHTEALGMSETSNTQSKSVFGLGCLHATKKLLQVQFWARRNMRLLLFQGEKTISWKKIQHIQGLHWLHWLKAGYFISWQISQVYSRDVWSKIPARKKLLSEDVIQTC